MDIIAVVSLWFIYDSSKTDGDNYIYITVLLHWLYRRIILGNSVEIRICLGVTQLSDGCIRCLNPEPSTHLELSKLAEKAASFFFLRNTIFRDSVTEKINLSLEQNIEPDISGTGLNLKSP